MLSHTRSSEFNGLISFYCYASDVYVNYLANFWRIWNVISPHLMIAIENDSNKSRKFFLWRYESDFENGNYMRWWHTHRYNKSTDRHARTHTSALREMSKQTNEKNRTHTKRMKNEGGKEGEWKTMVMNEQIIKTIGHMLIRILWWIETYFVLILHCIHYALPQKLRAHFGALWKIVT